MKQSEIEIRSKIKVSLDLIHNLSSEDRLFNLDTIVNSISAELQNLINITQDVEQKTDYERIWNRLDNTNESYVNFAEQDFQAARKKNAPRKREIEYRQSLKKAIGLVEMELSDFA